MDELCTDLNNFGAYSINYRGAVENIYCYISSIGFCFINTVIDVLLWLQLTITNC